MGWKHKSIYISCTIGPIVNIDLRGAIRRVVIQMNSHAIAGQIFEHLGLYEAPDSRVRIALAKNAGFSQNGSHMLLSLLASFGKTSMKQDKSKSTVACAIHFASTQHF